MEELLAAVIGAGLVVAVAFPLHEFCHAWAAYMLGDSTARWQGRLTLNPVVHFDPLGGLILFITAVLPGGFIIGWAKPTPVNPYNLRHGRRGESLVAALGPVSNLLLAIAVAIPLRLVWSDGSLVQLIMTNTAAGLVNNVVVFFVAINVLLFVFNLLPVPPLDGWKIVGGLVNARLAYQMRQVEQYGFLILLAIILLGGRVLGEYFFALVGLFTGPAGLVPLGLG